MICEVCRGREIITVPVYRSVSGPVARAEMMGDVAELKSSYREFPCPACAKWAEADRVKVMQAHVIMPDVFKSDRQAVESVRRSAANQLADMILKGDSFVRMAEAKVPADIAYRHDPESTAYQFTVGVVSKDVVASIDDRIARHQEGLTKEVIEEAAKQINIWGSHYGSTTISKDEAVRSLNGALKTVLTRRKVREA